MFGWNYYDTGGGALEKFHPATLMGFAVVALMAARCTNPVSGFVTLAGRYTGFGPYLAANLFMIVYAARLLGLPFTIFIETFIGAALVFVAFHEADDRSAHRLALLIHALLMINALLGFAEAIEGIRLTPLVVNGEELLDEPRSTALLGHPLGNAILMGAYVVILALGGGRDLPAWARPMCFLVALASLVPFGGRAATAVTLVVLAGLGLQRLLALLRGGAFDVATLISLAIGVPSAALLAFGAFQYGAFDTFIARLSNDEGSAATRIEMFALFAYLSPYDLVFGPDPDMLQTWVRLHGLDYGIESFPVAFVLNYGLLCAAVFFPAFGVFLWAVVARLRSGAWVAIVYFLAVAVTSLSLSSKSPTLSVFMMLIAVLLRDSRLPITKSLA